MSDRHSSDTVSESERCSDTSPTPCRSSIGVGEVLRYCSDTAESGVPDRPTVGAEGAPIPFRHGVGAVSESERCSDKVSEQDRSKISINSRFIELFIQHISSSS